MIRKETNHLSLITINDKTLNINSLNLCTLKLILFLVKVTIKYLRLLRNGLNSLY